MSKEVKLKVDHQTEMLEIHYKDELLFLGNFWDFERPADLIRILEEIGIQVKVEEYDY